MIDGLKLTMSGEEIRKLLQEGIRCHQRRVERWKRELTPTPEEQTEDEPLLPSHICENEAEEHEWRAEVLAFIREHIEGGEVYRLGEADLKFGELLPEKPGWMQQDEYERETGVAFNLERLTKEVSGLTSCGYRLASDVAADEADDSAGEVETTPKRKSSAKRRRKQRQ